MLSPNQLATTRPNNQTVQQYLKSRFQFFLSLGVVILDDGKGFRVEFFNNVERGRCYRIINNRGPGDFGYVEMDAEQFGRMVRAGQAKIEEEGRP
jgi:hypothetical protein